MKFKLAFFNIVLSILIFLLLLNAFPSKDLSINNQNYAMSHYGYLKLNLVSNNLISFTEFYFNSNASQGLDPGYDASLYGNLPSSFSIYSHLVQGDTGIAYSVQSLSDTDMNNITIPIGINASQGQEIVFSIAQTDILESINIYLEDREANTLILLNESTYSFTPSTNLSGTGRFYIKFEADVLSPTEQALDELKIYSNHTNNTFIVKGNLESDTELRLFDINGRLINYLVLDKVNTEHTINTSSVNTGVYIVKLSNKNSENRTQKIIIQ
ncbi:T9SS type A sorting domain-containing protein [Winogradskyella sp. PG-2]|uniref:T9SS type A sorting domain-containing protein n=1 Tax=Winogradskyella sp. PG-2 TaxID=754409 RepID=UPI001493E955|nr:T9SS type A sorting domain-containing protein [Winogradskyella sp. PG-2]